MTVQIRRVSDDAIVGTGIAVSTDGRIVTCAHVVEAAISAHPRDAKRAEIGVYFPQARGGETKSRRATVAAFFPQHDDDVVLLQLVGGASPLAPEQIAVLGTADSSDRNPFRSYGYRRLEDYIAGWADGTIQGCIEPPEGHMVQCDPVQLQSSQINRGMSGAAVLDVERNLVVGIVSETWFPDQSTKDRDTAWAINARVLSLAPLGLSLRDESLPLRAAPEPKTDVAQARAAVTPMDRFAWNSAPDILKEWTGRNELLEQITQDWLNLQKHVTGLIGFGGEGKSSLARKWVDNICKGEQPSIPTPDGIFWWGFNEKRSVDEFLEAALKWMSGGHIDPRVVPSSSVRAQIIGAMLGAGRYLFVLDGLEVMQNQEGDRFGLLQSNDLRDLLTYFARSDNQSFCLVTSRAPLLDLMEYTTYTHREVDRLSAADGRALLRKLGVQGKYDTLDKLVADWDGHALTLSLLAAILTERYGGDVAHVADLPTPTMDEPRYERVHRVLRRYDEHLTDVEREFLKLFSAFRTPVHESAFDKVFLPLISKSQKPESKLFEIGKLGFGISNLEAMVKHLATYRILRFDAHERTYTTHPLIRNHYLALLTKGDSAQEKAAHEQIKDYYLSIAGDTPEYPTLDDLKPLIEVVHHACQANAYTEAHKIRRDRIDQEDRFILMHLLGAYDTYLNMVKEFFPDGNLSREPQGIPHEQSWILNTIGLCLMNLGRLHEAVPFYERAVTSYLTRKDWSNASTGHINLADLHAQLGVLEASTEAATCALDLARRAVNKQNEYISLSYHAWALHLTGELISASTMFEQAEVLIKQLFPQLHYIFSLWGIKHADHLKRKSDSDYARRVTIANMEQSELGHWTPQISQCHRVLGDLDADAGQHTSAREHYDTALKIARSISYRPALIEALLACGRWAAKHMKDAMSAFNDLNEALGYAVESGYRIYEADIRNALGWTHLANSDKQNARAETEHALQMSKEMGYYWGKVDAEEVLAALDQAK